MLLSPSPPVVRGALRLDSIPHSFRWRTAPRPRRSHIRNSALPDRYTLPALVQLTEFHCSFDKLPPNGEQFQTLPHTPFVSVTAMGSTDPRNRR